MKNSPAFSIAFADELFSALRGAGHGHDDDRGRHRGHGHDGHRGHDHGWHRGGRRDDDAGRFEGLVGRLQALASALGSPGDTPATTASISSPESGGSSVATSNLPTATASTGAEPAVPAAATLPGTLPAAPASTQADQPSPLLGAFRQLMDRLSPGQASTASTPTDNAARLKDFLLDMATALSAGGQGDAGLRPPVGGLVNLLAWG